MGTILIDKLLLTVVNRNASDLHIAVGQPPVLRLHGRLVKLETKTLEAEDTVALMKSITPERCQQELQEQGSTDFGFAFGDKARFRVSCYRQRGKVGKSGHDLGRGLVHTLRRLDQACPSKKAS